MAFVVLIHFLVVEVGVSQSFLIGRFITKNKSMILYTAIYMRKERSKLHTLRKVKKKNRRGVAIWYSRTSQYKIRGRVHLITISWCGGSVVSTRMLLSSHYLHDYSDFYSDYGINSLHTFV